MAVVSIPFDIDETTLVDQTVDYIESKQPGYVLADADPMLWLIEGIARMAAQELAIASQVPDAVLSYLGQNLFGVQPQTGSPATGTTTWTVSDSLGITIPAGTQILASGVAFQTTQDVVIPAGSISASPVNVTALQVGTDGNGISGGADPLNSLARVQSITFLSPTATGTDAETDDEYRERLGYELELLAPRPILPRDFQTFAARNAEVDRVVALDGYVPGSGSAYTLGNERTIGVCAINAVGQPISTTAKAAIAADLDARREINFSVYMVDPTYTTINVTATFKAVTGVDPSVVQPQVVAALNNYLSPANWGRTPDAGSFIWVNQPVVRYLEVAQVINEVQGVDFIQSLSIDGAGADINLSGAAPLTNPGTMAITAA